MSRAYTAMQKALEDARSAGATITGGHRVGIENSEAFYVRPALVEIPTQTDKGEA